MSEIYLISFKHQETELKINETSEFYRPTGARGSLLFFQLMSLCRLAEDLEVQMFSLPSQITPGKINMEPENTPLEKEKHLPNHHFQVLC